MILVLYAGDPHGRCMHFSQDSIEEKRQKRPSIILDLFGIFGQDLKFLSRYVGGCTCILLSDPLGVSYFCGVGVVHVDLFVIIGDGQSVQWSNASAEIQFQTTFL
jgi:hypothetical protein